MKKVILLFVIPILLFTSCNKEDLIIEPTLTSEIDAALKGQKKGKVSVCHKGKILNINGNALKAHLNHGDVSLVDADGDGYVVDANECGVLSGDCDDANPEVNPGMDEIPYNGIDEDCDPATLDDDLDEDGFLSADDCDDTNADVNPDAEEICGNDIDENCDGIVEECETELTYVPDNNFEAYLETHDENGIVVPVGDLSMGNGILNDDYVLTSKISNVTSLRVHNKNIYSLTGIEGFTSLKDLSCTYNRLRRLDISQNTDLVLLNCGYNQLNSLDVTKNTALERLECYFNNLTSLDVTKNTALSWLRCMGNKLNSLDVTKNNALYYFDCKKNELTTLDLSQNTALEIFECGFNRLTSLDISQNTALSVLRCQFNQLTSLDVSHNTVLNNIGCGDNQLTTLDVSQNTALNGLYCDNNQLANLDVSHNTALRQIYFRSNQLSSLDLSQNTLLNTVFCANNQLTSLRIKNSKNFNLDIRATNNPSLNCVEVDNPSLPYGGLKYAEFDTGIIFSDDCGY